MSKLKQYILLGNFAVILTFFVYSIAKNERVLSSGEIVLMELRPADPRSIMQGDYMTLRFSVGDSVRYGAFVDSEEYEGDDYHIEDEYEYSQRQSYQLYDYCVVRLDNDRVASFVRLTNSKDDVKEGEMLLRFSEGKSRWEKYVYFGADSYFFQEGTGDKYSNARYGMLKVVTTGGLTGTCSLIGLCGEDKKRIE